MAVCLTPASAVNEMQFVPLTLQHTRCALHSVVENLFKEDPSQNPMFLTLYTPRTPLVGPTVYDS